VLNGEWKFPFATLVTYVVSSMLVFGRTFFFFFGNLYTVYFNT
jgi:hypothetical protein